MKCLLLLFLLPLLALASPPPGYTLAFSGKFNTYQFVPIVPAWDLLPKYQLGQAYTPEFLGLLPNGGTLYNNAAYFTTVHDPSGAPSPWQEGYGELICYPYIDTTGHWRSGMISTCDTQGSGFSAALGYWEATFSVPTKPGIWPAFWLNDRMVIPYLGEQELGNHYEIDVAELYGYNPIAVNNHLHIWAPDGNQVGGADNVYTSPHGWAAGTLHTYGVLITSAQVTFYMDGVVMFATPAPADIANHKFFAMIDYALGAGYPAPTPPVNSMRISELNYYAPPPE